jgi:uncharacterized protein YndB with AHSA1/START domain
MKNRDFPMEIRHATIIRAAPEVVFDAFTTGQGLDAWFTQGAQVEAQPGGRIFFRWVDWGPNQINAQDDGTVLEVQRPARFVFQWHPDEPDYATTVEVDFQAEGEHTIVRLREAGFRDTPSGRVAFADCATGWGEALTLLKFYVEHGLRY